MTVDTTPDNRDRILIDVTLRPLIDGGTTSDMYSGAVALAIPITAAFQNLPMTNAARFGAKSCRNPPPSEKRYALRSVHFRPSRLFSGEAAKPPIIDPTRGTENTRS